MSLANVLWGIAVADAIGNPLEFRSPVTNEDFDASAAEDVLRVSDDTQMSLFCAEALHNAAEGFEVQALREGYLDWFQTQMADEAMEGTGLLSFNSLYHREAPGITCMSSLSALRRGREVTNDSKGNGTVMRCAPIAYWAQKKGYSRRVALAVAKADALITHKHPLAWQSSVTLTAIHLNLLQEIPFEEAVLDAVDELRSEISLELCGLLKAALDETQYSKMRLKFRAGVAEEALALAVGSVAHSTNYLDAIRLAITIPGDSDTVGGIAGGLAAACGWEVPENLKTKINTRDAIEYVGELMCGIIILDE